MNPKAINGHGTRDRNGNRVDFLDNLRTVMIFLVVLLHAGLVYESSGLTAFFWIVDDPQVNDVSGLLNLVLDILIIPTLFFVSGYFVPRSLSRRSAGAFVQAKVKRILLPWAIAAVTLIPLYKVLFLYSRNLPQEHWSRYFHFSNGIFSQNWLWFLPVLFLFEMVALILSWLPIDVARWPLKRVVAGVMLASVVYGTGMAAFGLQGWTKTFLIDFQNERFLVYLLVFLLGSFCYERRVFETDWVRPWLYRTLHGVLWLPASLYVLLILIAIVKSGTYLVSRSVDGWLFQVCYVLVLFGSLYLLLSTFKRYLNRQGRIWQALNASSYGVYIVHVIVLGGIALLMLPLPIPSLLKHLLLAGTTFVVSTVLVLAFQRTLQRIARHRSGSDRGLGQLTHRETAG